MTKTQIEYVKYITYSIYILTIQNEKKDFIDALFTPASVFSDK